MKFDTETFIDALLVLGGGLVGLVAFVGFIWLFSVIGSRLSARYGGWGAVATMILLIAFLAVLAGFAVPILEDL